MFPWTLSAAPESLTPPKFGFDEIIFHVPNGYKPLASIGAAAVVVLTALLVVLAMSSDYLCRDSPVTCITWQASTRVLPEFLVGIVILDMLDMWDDETSPRRVPANTYEFRRVRNTRG
ncbi:hypothetical protein N7454_005581 [Penicillium verhagenii]|nr:hypothetical protein N7454_005581 [Penicillium verhagenii]